MFPLFSSLSIQIFEIAQNLFWFIAIVEGGKKTYALS